MGKRIVFILLGALVVSLVITSVALAATPLEIYNDFAADGDLDGTYSNADLQAYLDDATLEEYSDSTIKEPLDELVEDMLTRDTFPFTGFQLMIAGIVAVALVGGGIGLRRLTRPQKS